jgi:hypothetical protein
MKKCRVTAAFGPEISSTSPIAPTATRAMRCHCQRVWRTITSWPTSHTSSEIGDSHNSTTTARKISPTLDCRAARGAGPASPRWVVVAGVRQVIAHPRS